MTLQSFVEDTGPPECTLAVVGEDGPLESMLSDAFGDLPVVAESRGDVTTDGETVLLLEGEEIVASSSLMDLYDALLAINSDLYVTGARGLGDVELPEVLANMDEFRFTLRGYPLAHKEKLLLIVISRYIEQIAWEAGSGTIRSSFQRLSRIGEEVGTRDVYDQLAETDLSVHVYGVPDRPPEDLEVSVHGGYTDVYRDAWFVVYRPEGDRPWNGAGGAALVALETDSRVWDGFWTYDDDLVADIEAYIDRAL